MPEHLRALLREGTAQLSAAGVPNPAVDAELILGHHLGVSRGRVQALAVLDEPVPADTAAAVRGTLDRRAAREPLQHLTGRAPFRELELRVGPGVFVPRPETEGVVQHAIDALAADPAAAPLAVDLCTGSGAIALAMATEVPGARVFAVEKSPEAHAWAARNVAALAPGRVELLLGPLEALAGGAPGPEGDAVRAALEPLLGRVSVVISNPPYVPDAAIPRDPEVRLFDPALALYGGPDGLDIVRTISRVALGLLRPGGAIVLEHGEEQGAAIRALLAADGWLAAETRPDLSGRDRATLARTPPR